jgi:myo-inositol-1-phosphate synthase
MIVDLVKIKQLLSLMESYISRGKFVTVNEARNWYFKSPDIEEAIYYNANQKNKFINIFF